MTSQTPNSISPVGRLTGLALGCVVFVCIVMIGFAGYLKYQLDHAELLLAAPPSSTAPDRDALDKLRRSLGYSGFVGLAQSYAVTHDAATLAAMKDQIKTADDIIEHLPNKITAEARRDLQTITTTCDAMMQKAEKSATDPVSSFTMNDMAPLYAVLPILDSRVETASTAGHLDAQEHLQFWAMLLTLVCWSSLIIAAAMAVGVYLVMRDRNSAPMRALAQSVKNMARGDMRSSIWGMERSDMVGELARAIDLARYHFSQLPDMSLLSDQGPVRLRFEGNTRSLFEAMMQAFTRDSEQVRNQATTLTDAVSKQHEAISLITSRVEAVLHNVEKRGLDGDQQMRQALHNLVGTAQALKNSQEHAADQLNRIVPYMQERAQGLAEITSIAGKQVAQTLQSLNLTEHGLKDSVAQSQDAIRKLSSTADDLGGRLFGAVNLLQASGKVLSETTEATQSRLNEAIEKLNQERLLTAAPPRMETEVQAPEDTVSPRIEAAVSALQETQRKIESRLSEPPHTPEDNVSPRIEAAVHALEGTHRKFEERLAEQTEATQTQINMLATQSSGLLTQTTTTAQTLSSAADYMRDQRAKFDDAIKHITGSLGTLTQTLQQQAAQAFEKTESTHTQNADQIAGLAVQIQAMTEKLTTIGISIATSAAPKPIGPDPLLIDLKADIKGEFASTTRNLQDLRNEVAALTAATAMAPVLAQPSAPTPDLSGQLRDQWFQMAAQIEATRKDLVGIITQQIDRLEAHIARLDAKPLVAEPARNTEQQIEQQTQILTELVATLGILDTHMQQLQSEVRVGRR